MVLNPDLKSVINGQKWEKTSRIDCNMQMNQYRVINKKLTFFIGNYIEKNFFSEVV